MALSIYIYIYLPALAGTRLDAVLRVGPLHLRLRSSRHSRADKCRRQGLTYASTRGQGLLGARRVHAHTHTDTHTHMHTFAS
eukprot:20540_4